VTKKIDKQEVLRKVTEGFSWFMSGHDIERVINDIDTLTDREKRWAKKHLDWRIVNLDEETMRDKGDPVRCPSCKSDDLYPGSLTQDVDNGYVKRNVLCADCHFAWVEIFKFDSWAPDNEP